MSIRKVFSIIISSLALYLFINMFLPFNGFINKFNDFAIIDGNTWGFSVAFSIFLLISIIAVITIYLLNLFGVLKEKWVSLANYFTGFIFFFHVSSLFLLIDGPKVGLFLGLVASLGMFVLSILWNFVSDKPAAKKASNGKIVGYDPKTGLPVYAKPKGFNPQTGEPIYE